MFLALIYLLSVCKCWRFVLDHVATEMSLTFTWCTWLSSWCVNMDRSLGLMVCGDGPSWYVEMAFLMVCGDGSILRTHGDLRKGKVYALIWRVILGVRMVSFLCHGIILIHV